MITSDPLSYSSDYLWSSLIQQGLPLVLTHTTVITSGPLIHLSSSDYLWSSLTQQLLPLFLSCTVVITSGPLLHSSDYLWSSLMQHWLPLVLSHTIVTSYTHWWVTSGKIELLTVWWMNYGNCLHTDRWSVVSCYCKKKMKGDHR